MNRDTLSLCFNQDNIFIGELMVVAEFSGIIFRKIDSGIFYEGELYYLNASLTLKALKF